MDTTDHRAELESLYGNKFIVEDVPADRLPDSGMTAVDAMRLIAEEIVLDGEPARNLATFVTTWMEPEAQRVIAANLHRNFIDHAEYPRTAEIEQRCIRMLADLFHAPRGDHRRTVDGDTRPPRRAREPVRQQVHLRGSSL